MVVAIHVTHEATQKIGGIGAVVRGLVCTGSYQKAFPRTMLYTPLFDHDGAPSARLGRGAEVLYSGLDRYDAANWKEKFSGVETEYGVHIVYGKKVFELRPDRKSPVPPVDIVAVDVWGMKPKLVGSFKYRLWEHFGIQSDRYAHDRDFEQYVRIGAVLKGIFESIYGPEERAVLLAHEYMGMPSALAFEIEKKTGKRKGDRTIFYAHEVSTARGIVEGHPGHDFAFYNVLRSDRDEGVSLEDEFGSFAHSSRNELVKAARHMDNVFAVSNVTKEEFLYLCPNADPARLHTVYNGIPVEKISYSEKELSIERLDGYCENLFNFRPNHVFTHVTRLVVSKGIWRDIRLLYYLDEQLAKMGKKGFYVLLASLIGTGRSDTDVARMEREYGWPVLHREGWPDLVGTEIDTFRSLELFNARSRAIKGIFINQFGFSQERSGKRVLEGMSLADLRFASDFEFGMSIYEPFGIAQLEAMPYGGIPIVSSSCGCAALLEEKIAPENFVSLDFTHVPADMQKSFRCKDDFKNVGRELRDLVETGVCAEATSIVTAHLPPDDKSRRKRFEKMQVDATLLDWGHVAAGICEHLKQ